ncbi:MAG: sugar phosphate nucleotidyltransferase [Proteobacteria bacterium]|nr:sugar phosphate nucleotidyltransferase [Pseudomonadota bacterium]
MPMTPPPGDDVYAVILAGGSGTRFWPKSRHLRPKQLCAIGGQTDTMIEVTLHRMDGFIPPARRVIVTHADQMELTRQICGDRVGHYIAEPEAKNTANALALAALEIEALAGSKGQPVMISLHADHMIRDEPAFRRALNAAVQVARGGSLTLLGVVPEYAETGFGYIERGAALSGVEHGFRVASFREKPDLETARGYLETKRFYWNAGLFVWRTQVLLDELTRTLAPSLTLLRDAQKALGGRFAAASKTTESRALLAAAYKQLPKISIDHAVLETSTNVAVVGADIGWADIGSWDALARTFGPDAHGNLLFGDGCLIDSHGTTVDTDGPFVAALGLSDHVVVSSGGAVLVCPKERCQDVKKIVDWLAERGRRDLL